MADTSTQINNDELALKLHESHLDEDQKNEFIRLLPEMSNEDKEHLMGLIEQSQNVKAKEDKAEAEYQTNLKTLNDEYGKRMEEMENGLETEILQEYEKADKKEGEEELKDLESELDNI